MVFGEFSMGKIDNGNRDQYVVFLPEALPFDRTGGNSDIHREYNKIPKEGATWAGSAEKAVSNLLYRGMGQKFTSLALGQLKRYGKSLDSGSRVFLIDTVNGGSVDRKEMETGLLAQKLATADGCPDAMAAYFEDAREMLEKHVWGRQARQF